MIKVDPQVYYDAAKKLTDIGSNIDNGTTKLVQALLDTGSMAGTSTEATAWATSYDARANDTIDNARRLAQTLPYFGSLVALAGYNHALADYNADINPHKGPAPTKPASVPAPVPLCWAGAPASGGPGDGLVSIAALMENIHIHIPDGNTDKLDAATTAWKAFLKSDIEYAGSRISDVASALRQNQAHEIADLDDLVETLSDSAYKIYASANQLATETGAYAKPLHELRANIKKTITDLEEAITITLAVDVLADFVSAGAGVILNGASLAAFRSYFETAADSITGFVNTSNIARILGLGAKEENVVANVSRDLDEIDSLTPQEIESEEASSSAGRTSPANTSNTPGTAEYDQRADELAKDPAHGGQISDKSRREAEVGLSLENKGQLAGPITRAPFENGKDTGEFVDANGQHWDMKQPTDTFPSNAGPMAGKPMPPTMRGAYNRTDFVSMVNDEIATGENVIIDPQNLSSSGFKDVQDAIAENPQWSGKVVVHKP
ncbi:hypothetical protein [Nocardia alni]|uniref:hypothetical protein n=1 Tax=Nocardia alni TaxID=2815723 RepID=UPI001C2306B9|nr:hypothetical protein [Nocardia alni]